jgi:hypothetical protein
MSSPVQNETVTRIDIVFSIKIWKGGIAGVLKCTLSGAPEAINLYLPN